MHREEKITAPRENNEGEERADISEEVSRRIRWCVRARGRARVAHSLSVITCHV